MLYLSRERKAIGECTPICCSTTIIDTAKKVAKKILICVGVNSNESMRLWRCFNMAGYLLYSKQMVPARPI